ncbi:hypothetical protein SFSGTM_17680 [Sulfuriferula nivalis]|uniref:Uncharacterized protein n=1 Tax=Sulfuriferula nivalis TaxID=2675298 RepID=A0A809SHS6_9PROT|nr:hypothetical protein SFSGTM_17680 [Sulfuriferula nivalis]
MLTAQVELYYTKELAKVAELVDALDLGSNMYNSHFVEHYKNQRLQ